MSVADLKKFGQMVAEDEKVRAKAKEIGIQNFAGQAAYAKTLGLEFTAEDLKNLAKESGMAGQELSEEQLEQVAGGFITATAAVALTSALLAVGAVSGAVAAGAGVASIGVAVGSEASTRW